MSNLKPCFYCNDDETKIVTNSSFSIYKDSENKWYISTDESDNEIFYCPKCGKKLVNNNA